MKYPTPNTIKFIFLYSGTYKQKYNMNIEGGPGFPAVPPTPGVDDGPGVPPTPAVKRLGLVSPSANVTGIYAGGEVYVWLDPVGITAPA